MAIWIKLAGNCRAVFIYPCTLNFLKEFPSFLNFHSMTSKKYRHLFFDLDRTLWDFEKNARESLEEMYGLFELQKKGIPDFEAFHSAYFRHNIILWERYRKGFILQKELKRKRMWQTLLDFKIADTELAEKMDSTYLELLPQKKELVAGARDLLDYLKNKDYPLHLITNGFQTSQYTKLKSSHLQPYFDSVITSELAGKSKPHPRIFEYALKEAKCEPEEALMIGDALEIDILGANNANMDSAYYFPHSFTPEKITPTYHIRTLSELKKVL